MKDTRVCLRCGADLADVMGVYVFVIKGSRLSRVPGLLCVEHGRNGQNNLSEEEYARLTERMECNHPAKLRATGDYFICEKCGQALKQNRKNGIISGYSIVYLARRE